MQFDRFARRAEEIVAAIPAPFLEGVVGVEVHRRALPDAELDGVFLLGECADDEVTAMTDPGAMRSRVHLYHGSFTAVARRDPDFDWERELAETILHEIRHHIEDRAGITDLLLEDFERYVEMRGVAPEGGREET